MDRSFRSGLILLAGITLLAAALVVQAILLETVAWTVGLAGAGVLLAAWGAFALRVELGALMRRRRAEIALTTLGTVGVLVALAYLSVLYPGRLDLTKAKLYTLSSPTVTMLKRLDKPVSIVFFHDPMMREAVELYELIAKQNKLITVEFYDPMLNPAQARLLGVQFAGTALIRSEDRKLQVHGDSETDIANAILRVSRGKKQLVCFLDGHGEPDPFSMESHDHLEGAPGHSHGLGAQYVLHERHGMAKARHGLEAMFSEMLRPSSFVPSQHRLVRPHPMLLVIPARHDGSSRRHARLGYAERLLKSNTAPRQPIQVRCLNVPVQGTDGVPPMLIG